MLLEEYIYIYIYTWYTGSTLRIRGSSAVLLNREASGRDFILRYTKGEISPLAADICRPITFPVFHGAVCFSEITNGRSLPTAPPPRAPRISFFIANYAGSAATRLSLA